MTALLFILVLMFVLSVLARKLSEPRVLFEVAMEQSQWDEIRRFVEAAGRL